MAKDYEGPTAATQAEYGEKTRQPRPEYKGGGIVRFAKKEPLRKHQKVKPNADDANKA